MCAGNTSCRVRASSDARSNGAPSRQLSYCESSAGAAPATPPYSCSSCRVAIPPGPSGLLPTSTAARPRLRTVLAVMVRRSSAASLLSVSRELAIALRSVSFGGGGCSVPLYSSSDRYSALSASRFACDSCRNLCAAGTRFSVVAARLAASTSATLVLVLVLERAEVVLPHILGLLARDGVHQLNAVARRFPGTKALSRAPLVVQLQPPPVHRRHSSCRQPPTADSPLLSLIRALVIPFTTVLKTVG
jgi:hypothetical protein